MTVVYMHDVVPKVETRHHRGQRYVLQYDPNAADGHKWCWHAYVTHTYEFVGTGNTIDNAARRAKQRIDKAMRLCND